MTLVLNTTLQPAYATQLPPEYLHSEEWYITSIAYKTLLNFEDDDRIQVLFNENQLSDGACQDIDEEIDRLFKRDGCPDIFSSESLNELRIIIAEKLSDLDLTKAIIH